MEPEINRPDTSKLSYVIRKHFTGVQPIFQRGIFSFEFGNMLNDFSLVKKDFEAEGAYPFLRKEKGKNICILVRAGKVEPAKKKLLIMLFMLTLATTTVAGYFFSLGLFQEGYIKNIWTGAFSFSLGLMLVLGSHELGHKITSIKNGVPANGPYFIPVPPIPPLILGTLGAIIKIRSPMPDKNSQVRLGVAGPITGFFFSIIILIIGLKLSFPVEHLTLSKGPILGESLLLKFLANMVLHIPKDMGLSLHPLAFAGWVGLLVTFLNLVPVGQLDGGHIARAVLGSRNHMRLSLFTCGLMSTVGLLGFFNYPVWPGWLFWGILGFILSKGGNPGAMNELKPLGKQEKILAIIAVIIFIITFMPAPIK